MGRGRNKSAKVWRAKVARVAKSVTLKNQETKLYEYIGSNSGVNGSSGLIPLYSNGGDTSGSNAPHQHLPLKYINVGTDEQSRIGNKITLKGMRLRFAIENDGTYVGMTQVRIICAWLDPNFTTITAGNLLYVPSATGNNVVVAQMKGPTHENSVIRRVVFDRVVNVYPGNIVSGAAPVNQNHHVLKTFNVNFHNKKYQFVNESVGQTGELDDLYIFMFAYAPGQINTTQVANVRFTGRVYYKDG